MSGGWVTRWQPRSLGGVVLGTRWLHCVSWRPRPGAIWMRLRVRWRTGVTSEPTGSRRCASPPSPSASPRFRRAALPGPGCLSLGLQHPLVELVNAARLAELEVLRAAPYRRPAGARSGGAASSRGRLRRDPPTTGTGGLAGHPCADTVRGTAPRRPVHRPCRLAGKHRSRCTKTSSRRKRHPRRTARGTSARRSRRSTSRRRPWSLGR